MAASDAPCQSARDLATQRFALDPMHSTVAFTTTILGAVKVRGRFTAYEGTVIYDAARPDRSSVTAIIRAASLTTDMDFRDDHLRSPDFFDVKRYPTIEFVSDRVTRTTHGVLVSGTLRMRGVSKRITFPAKLVLAPRLVGTTPNVAFSGELRLSRADFGIAGTNRFNPDYDPLTNMLADSVGVLLEVSGNRDSFINRTLGGGHPPGVADTVDRVLRAHGAAAAIATYRELRAHHRDAFAFDDDQLDILGHRLAEQGRIADAVAVLSLNAEVSDGAARALESLGEAQLLANDAAGALTTYRRVLQRFPSSTYAREMVRHLQVTDSSAVRPTTRHSLVDGARSRSLTRKRCDSEMRSTSTAIASSPCSIRCSCSAILGSGTAGTPRRSNRRPSDREIGHPTTSTAHVMKNPIARSTTSPGMLGRWSNGG
jgi:polyisoprenoid-binding protein YceI